jgi:hypothetical protein
MSQMEKTITLTDGTSLKGEVSAMTDGTYTITTPSMGAVKIAEKDIASIVTNSTLPAATLAPASAAVTPVNIAQSPEFQAVQTQIMNDPQLMGDIQKLVQDPDVMAVLSDPSFIALVQSGKQEEIAADPRIQKFSQNPNVQALIQKVQTK